MTASRRHLPARAQVADDARRRRPAGRARRARRSSQRAAPSPMPPAVARTSATASAAIARAPRNRISRGASLCRAKREQQARAGERSHDDLLHRAGVDDSLHGHGQDGREQQEAIARRFCAVCSAGMSGYGIPACGRRIPAMSDGRQAGTLGLPIAIFASAQFVMVLDSSVMNVSISQIVEDLDTTIQGVQLAITAYTLVMAALMLAGAKLGDILGRDRTFAIGLAIYGLGSLTTALSPNLTVLLIGWSLVEGIGAALVLPAIVSLIAAHLQRQAARAGVRHRRRRGRRGDRGRAADRRLGDDRVQLALRLRRRDGDRRRDPARAPPAPARAGGGAPAQARRGRRRALGARARPRGLRHPQEQRVGPGSSRAAR